MTGRAMVVPRFSVRHFSRSVTAPMRGLGGRGQESGKDDRSRVSAASILEDEKKGVFRTLDILPPKKEFRKQFRRAGDSAAPPPARAASMLPGQDWGDVWPAARTFHPAIVPLPVRQGVLHTKEHVVPSKWANAELMKIPNFLHLTPPVVAKHCAAISKFCTPWPKGLETDEDVERHFPLAVITSDHLNSNSSVRDRRARVVTLRFRLDSLQLDEHARDKFIRLVGERYCESSGEVTLTADRCPYRGQNADYASYLVTALFHESWREEEWEKKEVTDREQFKAAEDGSGEGREALEQLLNSGEDGAAVARYREEVRRLLGLPPLELGAEVLQEGQ